MDLELDAGTGAGIKEYLRGLQASIESQEATIESLRCKNKRLEDEVKVAEGKIDQLTEEVSQLKKKLDSSETANQKVNNAVSITEEITQAAQEAVEDQFLRGMAYEETTGLYYDYQSRLYYDATKRLFYNGDNGSWLSYDAATGDYIPLQNPERPDPGDSTSCGTESEPETDADEDGVSSPEFPSSPKISDTRNEKEESNKEPRELSEGEVSSPSPPPPPPPSAKEKKKKRKKKDYDNFYYLDDERSKKKLKKEKNIPCIRFVVLKSDSIELGKLFIATCKGATIGREGNHDVLLDDVSISKHHGKIEFERKTSKYYLTDIGSQNGTFIDGKRLSTAKIQSDPNEIGHGSLIKIGSTELICHVHPGIETCLKCEPGVVISSQPKLNTTAADLSAKQLETKRKSEMKQLRKKYGINNPGETKSADISKAAGYTDRADDRRRLVGSDNPFEKTQVASVEEPINDGNKGFKMLKKMGWKDGDGLGKGNEGRVEPVKAEERPNRQGLGANVSNPKLNFNRSSLKRKDIIKKTQERFNSLS